MLHNSVYFNINEFAGYGALKGPIATELNTLLREAIDEDNIEFDDCDALADNVQYLISDMRDYPYLYVSESLSMKIRFYTTQPSPD